MNPGNGRISDRRFFQLALAALSGGLLAAAFSPWETTHLPGQGSFLAWFAFLPILHALLPVNPSASRKYTFQLGFVMGLVFWLGTIYWLFHVSWAAVFFLSIYLALYLGLWAWLMGRFYSAWLDEAWGKELGRAHLLVAFSGAATWVGIEWSRGWMLGGFPWNFAAVTQAKNLALIQVAQWTGVYGLSFVVVFFNLSLWLTWRRMKIERFSRSSWRYEFSVALLLVAVCLMIGMRTLLRAKDDARRGVSIKVGLVQPAIPQEVKYEALSRGEQRARLENLTRAASTAHPDLIIWPETALVDSPNDGNESRIWLQEILKKAKTPLLFGTLDVVECGVRHAESGGGQSVPQKNWFNAAMLLGADGKFSKPYHKLHLVPFGEYIPLEKYCPWIKYLTPIPGSFDPGNEAVLFGFKDLKFGPLICFEDSLPSLARNMKRGGADILLNLTNDAWFKESSGASQHLANALFRAVENRRPLIRCSNHGMTVVVGPLGQIEQGQFLAPFTQGFLITEIAVPQNHETFYSHHGDWFAWGCVLILLAAIAFSRASCKN